MRGEGETGEFRVERLFVALSKNNCRKERAPPMARARNIYKFKPAESFPATDVIRRSDTLTENAVNAPENGLLHKTAAGAPTRADSAFPIPLSAFGSFILGPVMASAPAKLPLPGSAAELSAALSALSYDARNAYAARLGRDHRDNPGLLALAQELLQAPSSSSFEKFNLYIS